MKAAVLGNIYDICVSERSFDKVKWISIVDKLIFILKRYFCGENIML
jgi:hypothetical protein